MPLTSVSPFSLVRDELLLTGANPSANFTFASNGFAVAYVVALGPGERIDEVGFESISSSGSFDAVIAVESMSGSDQGSPSGTIKTSFKTGEAKSATLHASDFSAGRHWVPINPYRNDTGATEIVAVTFRKISGSGTMIIATQINAAGEAARFPFVSTRAASSGGFSGEVGGVPMIALRNDLQQPLAGCSTLFTANSVGSDSSATTDRLIGNKWTVQFACRLSQLCFRQLPYGNGSFDVCVYVNDSLETNQTLSTLSLDGIGAGALSDYSMLRIPVGPVQLEAGDVVRMIIKGNSADGVYLPTFDFDSSADRLFFTGGTNIHRCYGSTAPVWVDTATNSLAAIFPIIDQVNFAAGLGGSPGGGIQRSVIYKNVTDQWVFFRLVDRAGVPINGEEGSSFAVTLQGAKTGHAPETAEEASNEPVFFGDGVYGIQLELAETDFDVIVLTATHANGSTAPVIIETSPQIPEVTIVPDSLTLQN